MPPRGSPAATPVQKIKPVWPATFTDCMEQLQLGYVVSVAATAGCLVQPIERDRIGMDVLFIRPGPSEEEEISVYAQLKSTTTVKPDPDQDNFSFRFKHRGHMQRLVNPRSGIKAILIVMATHPDQSCRPGRLNGWVSRPQVSVFANRRHREHR